LKCAEREIVKILIVDDHAIVRKGLSQILVDDFEHYVIGEAQDADEALNMIRKQPWDLIILDINLPGRSGLELLSILRDQFPGMPVLMLSTFSEDQYAIRALISGAAGYLNKQSAPEELIMAIKKIRNGERYLSENQTSLLLSTMINKKAGIQNGNMGIDSLSNRELEILIMIASGKTLTDIAHTLSLSIRTISTYRSRILDKLSLSTNNELIAFALHNHLVD
jgi:two-component system, NarL family, invasion response regulator UvrY